MSDRKEPSTPPELRERLAAMPPDRQRDLEHVWDRLARMAPRAIEVPGTDEAWDDLKRRVAQGPGPRRPHGRSPLRPPSRSQRSRRRAGAVLVSVAILAAAGVWTWPRPVVVQAPPGAVVTVQLPDGSAVELNSDSELRYPRRFEVWPFVGAEARRVVLRGEGFFDVARSERPFVVETDDVSVEALGTQFNVRARGTADGPETAVTLVSGRIRVSLRGDAESGTVLSEAGAFASVVPSPGTGSRLVTRKAALAPTLAWRQRAFSVVDRSLASLLREVERHFAVDIVVEGPLVLADSMNVFYGPQVSPEDILHDLCLVQGCRFRRTSRGFAVTAKPPPASSRDA